MATAIHRPTARIDLIAPIGRGGMAEVYLVALHSASGVTKLAALKRIWPELACDPDFVAMFLDEAQLAVRLNHPNVVQTYEVFSQGDQLTLSMEYLEGQPLTRVLTRVYRELGLEQRLRIICDILAGLDHAHNLCDYDGTPLGIVHRDIGPQNVFVTYTGHVKVMDFGVAKRLEGRIHSRPGRVKGRLPYMAPEQLRGELVDQRADLYAVGVILWEVLAGRRRWQGQTEAEIARALREGAEPPGLPVDVVVPANFDAVCRRALAPRAEDRFATAAEMHREVARLVPAALESHDRSLSRIVSLAFASERAEQQALIEAHLRGLADAPAPPAPPPVMAAASAPPAPQRMPTRTAIHLGIGVAGALAIFIGVAIVGHRLRDARQATAVGPRLTDPARLTIAPRTALGSGGGPAYAPRVYETARPSPRPAPPADVDEGSVAERVQARSNDPRATHRKRRLLASQRFASPPDHDWSLPEMRTPRTLARPLDTEDPYAP